MHKCNRTYHEKANISKTNLDFLSDVGSHERRIQAKIDFKSKNISSEQLIMPEEHKMYDLQTKIIHWLPDFPYTCEEWFK